MKLRPTPGQPMPCEGNWVVSQRLDQVGADMALTYIVLSIIARMGFLASCNSDLWMSAMSNRDFIDKN